MYSSCKLRDTAVLLNCTIFIVLLLREFCCTAVSCVGFHLGSLHRALSHEMLDLYRFSLPPRHRAAAPDGVVVRKIYRGRQPPTGPALYRSQTAGRSRNDHLVVTSVHRAASACPGGCRVTYGKSLLEGSTGLTCAK